MGKTGKLETELGIGIYVNLAPNCISHPLSQSLEFMSVCWDPQTKREATISSVRWSLGVALSWSNESPGSLRLWKGASKWIPQGYTVDFRVWLPCSLWVYVSVCLSALVCVCEFLCVHVCASYVYMYIYVYVCTYAHMWTTALHLRCLLPESFSTLLFETGLCYRHLLSYPAFIWALGI